MTTTESSKPTHIETYPAEEAQNLRKWCLQTLADESAPKVLRERVPTLLDRIRIIDNMIEAEQIKAMRAKKPGASEAS